MRSGASRWALAARQAASRSEGRWSRGYPSRPDHSHMLLLPERCQPEQPRVLVRLRVHREQLGSLDVHPGGDLVQRLLAQPVRDRRVPPERPELRQAPPGAPQPELVGQRRRRGCRPIRATPGTAECVDRELAGRQLPLELRSRRLDVDRVRCRCHGLHPTHRREHLGDIGLGELDAVEHPRQLLLVRLGRVGRGRGARRPPAVANATPPAVGVAVVAAPALDAAHQAYQGVGAPLVRAPTRRVRRPPPLADRLDAVEELRVHRGREPGRLLLLVPGRSRSMSSRGSSRRPVGWQARQPRRHHPCRDCTVGRRTKRAAKRGTRPWLINRRQRAISRTTPSSGAATAVHSRAAQSLSR